MSYVLEITSVMDDCLIKTSRCICSLHVQFQFFTLSNVNRQRDWIRTAGLKNISHPYFSFREKCTIPVLQYWSSATMICRRDCINGVYGCSDMTECVPNFEFAPQRTFTIGDVSIAECLGFVCCRLSDGLTILFQGKVYVDSILNNAISSYAYEK